MENKKQLTILSYGGGQDSTAILYKMIYDQEFRNKYAPDDLLVVMANTNDEHQETYQHVNHTKKICEDNGIEFVFITSDMGYHPKSWQGLREFYNLKNTVGSKAFPKTCTDNLKIKPIYNFVDHYIGQKYGFESGRKKAIKQFHNTYGKINVLIGFARGEERRLNKELEFGYWLTNVVPRPSWKDALNKVYPLIDLGMDRKDCQEYIKSTGNTIPMPSNCVLCPWMSEQELLWLYRFRRADYEDWVRIEKNKMDANQHMGDKNMGVWGTKTLSEVLVKAQEKYGHWTDEELMDYKMSHGHCVMSKY